MSRKRHRPPPPADDRKLKRTIFVAAAQSLIREALVIVLRELWRGGPW